MGRSRKLTPLDPSEWVLVGHWAIRTRSVLTAARIAARIRKLGGHGRVQAVEWMSLTLFEELVRQQGSRTRKPPARRKR